MPDNNSITLFLGIAATAGTFFGIFVTALLSRASATSSLRQNWINSLRSVFSKFLTSAEKWVNIPDKNSEEAYFSKIEVMEQVHQAKLFLNQQEKQHQDIMSEMENLIITYSKKDQSPKEYQEKEKPIISSLMQGILKEEWNRVRDGEILWSINNFFKFIKLPEWFYISRIRLFWLTVLFLSIVVVTWWCSHGIAN
ncbi:MAG: hypothetical protein KUG72_12705 [Pseudomonadales bacterium]|nr:hypothetical protein [Pseudomonadales bacterium]